MTRGVTKIAQPILRSEFIVYEALRTGVLNELMSAWDSIWPTYENHLVSPTLGGSSAGACMPSSSEEQRWATLSGDTRIFESFCALYLTLAEMQGVPQAKDISAIEFAQNVLDDEWTNRRRFPSPRLTADNGYVTERARRSFWSEGWIVYAPYLVVRDSSIQGRQYGRSCIEELVRHVEYHGILPVRGNVSLNAGAIEINENLVIEIGRQESELLIGYETPERSAPDALVYAARFLPGYKSAPYSATRTRAIKMTYMDSVNTGMIIDIAPQSLRGILGISEWRCGIDYIDPFEVAEKIENARRWQSDTKQGLPITVHDELVRILSHRGRAMSFNELNREMGFVLDLDPSELPPGRILAYAPSQRFLSRSSAFYVLCDWIETETYKKGRIARHRIATPLQLCDMNFDDAVIEAALRRIRSWRCFGLLDIDAAATSVALELPGQPTDIYHRKRIRNRILDFLGEDVVSVGKGYCLHRDSAVDRLPRESMGGYRKRALDELLANRTAYCQDWPGFEIPDNEDWGVLDEIRRRL